MRNACACNRHRLDGSRPGQVRRSPAGQSRVRGRGRGYTGAEWPERELASSLLRSSVMSVAIIIMKAMPHIGISVADVHACT